MRRLLLFVVTLALIGGAVIALVWLDAHDGTRERLNIGGARYEWEEATPSSGPGRYAVTVWIRMPIAQEDLNDLTALFRTYGSDQALSPRGDYWHAVGASFTTEEPDFSCQSVEEHIAQKAYVQDVWCRGDPRVGRSLDVVLPDFTTWDQLQGFINGRHERLREVAETTPEMIISASVTPARGLTKEEVAELISEYRIETNYVAFRAGETNGVVTLTPSVTLASLEESHRGSGQLVVTAFVAKTTAAELVRLIDEEPTIALVYADLYLDRRAGLVPDDVTPGALMSIFNDYERLAPGEGEDSTPEP